MRAWIYVLFASFLAAAPGSAQCSRFISVENATGENMSGLLVSLGGLAPMISGNVEVEPDADPICPQPSIGGDLIGNIGFGWGIDCVDPGSTVTFKVSSHRDITGVPGGGWSNLDGDRFQIPGESFILSPDCNGNCIADELDIAAGTSADADGDGVPDECQPVIDIPVLAPWGMAASILALLGAGVAALLARRRSG